MLEKMTDGVALSLQFLDIQLESLLEILSHGQVSHFGPLALLVADHGVGEAKGGVNAVPVNAAFGVDDCHGIPLVGSVGEGPVANLVSAG